MARFAKSRSGQLFRASCERFGVDPAAAVGYEDDVVAANLRVALMAGAAEPEPEAADGKLSDAELLRQLKIVEDAV